MKRVYKTVIFFLLISFVFSCAYFNMYYNAKESYNDAEIKRKDTNVIDKALYENSLKELSKILEFYPDSKWVDDALLMMGLCYLRQEDYYKAQRKFNELITNYSKSELIEEAKIHLAEVEIGLKNFDEARKLIESIKTENVNIETSELMKLNANMSLSIGDSSGALDLLIKATNNAQGNAEKIDLYQRSAELADKIRDYKTSSKLFKELAVLQTEKQKQFDNMVNHAEALNKLKQTDEAIKILEDITQNEDYSQFSLKGKIKLTKLYLDKGDSVRAYDKLDEILKTTPKDRDNGALLSETAYYFGEYYFNLKKDFNSAENMYDSAGYYDRKNEYFQQSNNRLNLIRNFRNTREKVESFSIQRDSLRSKIVRLTLKSKTEGISDESLKSLQKEIDQSQKKMINLESSYVNDKMNLAEKTFYELGLTDTAKVLFDEVSKEKSYPHQASKAMLSLILSDSSQYFQYEDSLLINFPNTEGANYIRAKRGIEQITFVEDSAKYLFNIASQLFLDSLYNDAMEEYIKIGMEYEKSPLSPKILQAAGMIAENYLKDYTKAAEIYTTIKEKYSGTTYSRFAANKLIKDGEKIEKVKKEEEKISDTERWYLMDRRND